MIAAFLCDRYMHLSRVFLVLALLSGLFSLATCWLAVYFFSLFTALPSGLLGLGFLHLARRIVDAPAQNGWQTLAKVARWLCLAGIGLTLGILTLGMLYELARQ